MFCYQCEQTAQGTGCTKIGVCGKQPDVAALQDLLVFALKGIAFWADTARTQGKKSSAVDRFMLEGLFTTVTNVDFDADAIAKILRKSAEIKETARAMAGTVAGPVPEAANWQPASDLTGLVQQGEAHGVQEAGVDPDVKSVIEMIIYGMKGYAAYADHALTLGSESDELYAFTHKALAATLNTDQGLMEFVNLAMETGRINLVAMELLNKAHTDHYGHPMPTTVTLGTRKGKGILVSGHDLRMLEELLKQTEGRGIDVYTHGEMLPAHGYPGLKQYEHLAGNFGGAWQDQAKEFPEFPGAIIFNTNCIQRPAESYKDRLFTWGLVQWPDVNHIDGWDFSAVIDKALSLPDLEEKPGKNIMTGFGHNAVLGVAEQVINAVKAGDIRHFFLIGGCDGAKSGRNYYTEFAEKVPNDCVILTLACGKYRFNKLDFGNIAGIPRLLDVGQCNDAFSAVQIALALANAFNCEVNDLPLSLVLSWYEQKAVAILLTLLHLGIKNIKLGPSLPAFVTPNVLNFLVEKFNITPITTAEEDLAQILG